MKTIIYGFSLFLLVTSCASDRYADAYYNNDNYYNDYSYGNADMLSRADAIDYSIGGRMNLTDTFGYGSARLIKLINEKKIVRTASVHLTTKTPDSIPNQLSAIAEKFNGYVKENGSYYSTIRVEAQYLDSALLAVEALGRLDSKSIRGNDVTSEYLDNKMRLENAEKARTRYLELLEKAENVEAALLVEKELERLNETIEMLKGNLNKTDHLVAYSTINIYTKEKKKPGLLGYIGIGLYKSVKWLFVRN